MGLKRNDSLIFAAFLGGFCLGTVVTAMVTHHHVTSGEENAKNLNEKIELQKKLYESELKEQKSQFENNEQLANDMGRSDAINECVKSGYTSAISDGKLNVLICKDTDLFIVVGDDNIQEYLSNMLGNKK